MGQDVSGKLTWDSGTDMKDMRIGIQPWTKIIMATGMKTEVSMKSKVWRYPAVNVSTYLPSILEYQLGRQPFWLRMKIDTTEIGFVFDLMSKRQILAKC